MIAVPLTIWSARRWIAQTACRNAIAPPAAIAIRIPLHQWPVLSAPQMPKKAPVSSMPSRPMLTTPDRSENMPPIEAKASGVAYLSVAAISADHAKTVLRFPTEERVPR